MHESSFYLIVLAVSFLLFLAAYVAVYVKQIRLPYTVALTVFGIILSVLSRFEPFDFLNALELSPDLVFYLFLPMLIFEGAYNMRFLELRANFKTVSVLAVGSLLISAFFIGWVLFQVFKMIGLEIPFLTLLLFGSLISATDPIAALAIFKELGVPKRLRMLLEGESIANDGTALVLFQVVLGIASGGALTAWKAAESFGNFWFLVVGGIVFGAILGVIFSKMIERIRNLAVVEITLTLVLAHTAFIFAEKFLHVSGIIATAAAAMVIGNYGRYKISPEVRNFMEHFWEYMAFVANSLIFLLIGLSIREAHFGQYILPILIALVAVFIARFISIYAVVPFTNKWSKEEKTPLSWQFILSWGGLRGALPMAIVLLLPADSPFLPAEHRELLLVLTVSVIYFTLLFQAPTLTKFLNRFRLTVLTPVQQLEQEEGFLLMDSAVLKKLNEMKSAGKLTESTHQRLYELYSGLHKNAEQRLRALIKDRGEILSRDEMLFILRKHLLGIERQAYIQLFDKHEISERMLVILKGKIERQIDRLERRVPQASEVGKGSRLALWELEHRIYKFIDKIDLPVIKKWSENRKLDFEIEVYQKYRARKIAVEKAMKELDNITATRAFIDQAAIDDARKQYNYWFENSLKRLDEMEKKNPILIESIRFVIGNTVSIALEQKILRELLQKGILAENAYAEVNDYLHGLIVEKHDVKKMYFKELEGKKAPQNNA